MAKQAFSRIEAKANKVSIGETSAAVSLRIDREKLPTVDLVDAELVESRVEAKLEWGMSNDDAEGQELMEGTEQAIKAEGEIHRLSVGASNISLQLSFHRDAVNVGELANVANRKCKFSAKRLGPAGNDNEIEDD